MEREVYRVDESIPFLVHEQSALLKMGIESMNNPLSRWRALFSLDTTATDKAQTSSLQKEVKIDHRRWVHQFTVCDKETT